MAKTGHFLQPTAMATGQRVITASREARTGSFCARPSSLSVAVGARQGNVLVGRLAGDCAMLSEASGRC
jgi:hypothetical protein